MHCQLKQITVLDLFRIRRENGRQTALGLLATSVDLKVDAQWLVRFSSIRRRKCFCSTLAALTESRVSRRYRLGMEARSLPLVALQATNKVPANLLWQHLSLVYISCT